jgi:hypothetical protein
MKPGVPRRPRGFVALILLLGAASSAGHAQSLFNLHIGDSAASSSIPNRAASAEDSFKTYRVRKWTLDNGNELSVSTAQSGSIVYLESDWSGKNEATGCDLPGFKFGQTTLSEIRKRMGSNGFIFKQRSGVIEIPEGVVMLNSYQVGSNVVTFITKVSEQDYVKANTPGSQWVVADHARLDAISISSAEFAQGEWGDRIEDPGYKPATWK